MSIEYQATIIALSIIGVIYGIALIIILRVFITIRHYTKATRVFNKHQNIMLKRFGSRIYQPMLRIVMNKYFNLDSMLWKLHKWTYNQFYGDLEDDLEEVENELARRETADLLEELSNLD